MLVLSDEDSEERGLAGVVLSDDCELLARLAVR